MLLHPLDKRSVNQNDKYLVIRQMDQYDWRIVESQPTLEKAEKALDILQKHSNSHNGGIKYDIREMGAYTCLR